MIGHILKVKNEISYEVRWFDRTRGNEGSCKNLKRIFTLERVIIPNKNFFVHFYLF